jgi:hypothetical protein
MTIFPSGTSLGRHAQQLTLLRPCTVRQAQSSRQLMESFQHPGLDQIVEGVIDLDPHYQRGL